MTKYICDLCPTPCVFVSDVGCPAGCLYGNETSDWKECKETDKERVNRIFREIIKSNGARPSDTTEQDKTECRDPKARYYGAGGLEVMDVIKAKLTPEQFKGWLLGNLIKYSCRANHKGQFQRDIEKVKFYSAELFNNLE